MPVDETCRLNGESDLDPTNRWSDQDRFLMPDRQRRFQRRPVSLAALHEHLVLEVRQRLGASRPKVILCCGKCRVGSTPLANVFGHAGLPTFYQPIKTLLRHLLVEETCPPLGLATSEPIIFIKETFGPYVEAECMFNPLDVLLDAGFRAEDITLLILERDPGATLASWQRCWHDRADTQGFVDRFFSASSNAHRVADTASRKRIPVNYYLYEESKQPEIAMAELFGTLGLRHRFKPSIMHGWTKGDSLQGANTAVTFFRQPDDYRIEQIHLDLDEYRFVARGSEASNMLLWQNDKALAAELDRLYDVARMRAQLARLGGIPV